MKTMISDSTGFSGKVSLKKILLICGILSSLLYVTTTILGAMRWKDYISTTQTVSELIAIDAPSAPLVIPLLLTYSVLMFAFGLGVWRSSGQKRVLRIVACFIVGKEVLGLAATIFAPMHMRGQETTLTDTMHALLTGVGVFLCMFPAIGLGATVFGKQFRLYSKGEELCPFKDDRDILIEKMKNSDGVIFASPNYSLQVSALMKIFPDRQNIRQTGT